MDTATEAPPQAALAAPEVDSLGRSFDASKFRQEKDILGRWKNRHSGRRRAVAPSAPRAPRAPGAGPEPAAANFDDVNRAAGPGASTQANAVVMEDNATADTVIGVIQTALVLIGDEEGVLTDMEKTLLRRPLVRVLEKYHVGNDVLPVEVDLALAMAGIVVTRLQKPKTATFWVKAKAWAVNVWFRRAGRAIARDVREAVQSAPASL